MGLSDSNVALIVADDERKTRVGICDGVDWSLHGVGVVRSAENGAAALELVERYSPCVLLCDLRMPVMDGVALANRVHQSYPNTEIIFMSGYTDKPYLMAAIKLRVADYIEKPIVTENLTRIVSRAVERVSKVALPANKDSVTDRYHSDAASVLELDVKGSDIVAAEIRDRSLGFGLTGAFASIAFACSDPDQSARFITMDFYNALDAVLLQSASPILAVAAVSARTAIVHLSSDSRSTSFVSVARALHNAVRASSSSPFVASALGPRVHSLADLRRSAKCAREEVDRAFVEGYADLLQWRSRDPDPLEVDPFRSARSIVDAVTKGDFPGVRAVVAEVERSLRSTRGVSSASARDCLARIVVAVEDALGLSPEIAAIDSADSAPLVWQMVSGTPTLPSAVSGLLKHFEPICEMAAEQVSRSRPIHQAIMLIESSVDSALSVEQLAQQIGVTPNHLSSLFRKKTGQTIGAYRTALRVRHAKELLSTSGLLVYEIAAQVGYGDYRSFSRVFRRVTGESPTEYRQNRA